MRDNQGEHRPQDEEWAHLPGRYIERLQAAEMHWFFVQGEQACEHDLYLPGVMSFLAGIETSIRFTMSQMDDVDIHNASDLGPTLSNPLLRRAKEAGLPIDLLAFPEERDFADKLRYKNPYVEVVRIRHDLAHGNTVQFVNTELGQGNAFLTPECFRELATTLGKICEGWTAELSRLRATLRKI